MPKIPYRQGDSRYLDWHSRQELRNLGTNDKTARIIYGHSPDPLFWKKPYSVGEVIEDLPVPNFDSLTQLEETAEYLHDLAMDYDGSLGEFKLTVRTYLEELEENE